MVGIGRCKATVVIGPEEIEFPEYHEKISFSLHELVSIFNCKDWRDTIKEKIKDLKKEIEELYEIKAKFDNEIDHKYRNYNEQTLIKDIMYEFKVAVPVEKAKEKIEWYNKLLYIAKPTTNKSNWQENIVKAKQVPIENFIEFRGGKANCIFHHDENASMTLYKNNTIYCFGCNKKADVIDIARTLMKLDFKDTINYLLK